MAKRKMTVAIDDDLVTAIKVTGARAHKPDYKVVEDALRSYFGMQGAVDRIWSGLGTEALAEDEAVDLAVSEVRAARTRSARSR
jgi:hypothetical protein